MQLRSQLEEIQGVISWDNIVDRVVSNKDGGVRYMEIYNHLADTCEYYISSPRTIEFLTYEDFCIHVINTIFTVSRGLTNNNLINVFSLLLHVFDYNAEFEEENEEALKPSSDEEIKQSMVAWATERGI